MTTLPDTLFWQRLDAPGSDQVVFSDHDGLHARGTAVASTPVAYRCGYELATGGGWATEYLEVVVEGGGWSRSVRLERSGADWRVTASEEGNLDRALTAAGRRRVGLPGIEDVDLLHEAIDVDLATAPLFNTLPIRRLGLLHAPAGTTRELTMAFVRLPSLEIIPSAQTYTVLDPSTIRYASGSFTADLTVDARGFVTHYPGLASQPQ